MTNAKLRQFLEARWMDGAVEGMRRIEGGEWNDAWRFDCKGKSYVVRQSNPALSAASVAWEHELLRELADHLREVAAPIPATDGKTLHSLDGRAVTVFPLLPGAPPGESEATQSLAAKALGRLHNVLVRMEPRGQRPGEPALRDLDWDANVKWNWTSVLEKLQAGPNALPGAASSADEQAPREWICSQAQFLADERRRAEEWIAMTACRAPLTGVVHGDYFRGNLLVQDDDVTGIVDWDEAHIDWMAYELGWSAWEFCTPGDSLDFDAGAFDAFVRTYRDAGGRVPATEDDLLLPAVRCRHLVEVLWALDGGVFDAGYCARGIRALQMLQ